MSTVFDSHAYARNVTAVAQQNGWQQASMSAVRGYARPWFHLPAATLAPMRLYISAGIHGDEPASSYAALELLKHVDWFAGCEVFLFPLLNPAGMELGTRENADGIDLNRDYHAGSTEEVSQHQAALNQLPRCHLYLHLHEDWEAAGAYLYEVQPPHEPSATPALLSALAKHLPIEQATSIDGFDAEGGVITRPPPLPERDDWPEVYYFEHQYGDYHGYTLETPSALTLDQRIAGHVAAVHAAADFLRANRTAFDRS
ncbi:M14 family metallopeptidase [Cerasicoccus maritimus]|uniref:M14 family metallopeptidase n=1 Tax=Cerasicoccus maritimus TaxID=490089 RepID=UPI0028526242|nr:M14 family metallocarboxypeptidase [Cerasicoccus maritimus]